ACTNRSLCSGGMLMRIVLSLLGLTFCCEQALAQESSVAERIDAYLQPYVQSGNFSGAVLAKENGKIVFEKAYGFADRERKVPNTLDRKSTRLNSSHVAISYAVFCLK